MDQWATIWEWIGGWAAQGYFCQGRAQTLTPPSHRGGRERAGKGKVVSGRNFAKCNCFINSSGLQYLMFFLNNLNLELSNKNVEKHFVVLAFDKM